MTTPAKRGQQPFYEDDLVTLHHGDCLDVMRDLPDASVDAVVTDPPYGLGFMGKAWDGLPPGEEWARECLRVLRPGGHLLTFGGTRTWHRLAVAVEDVGFELRDSLAWLYGSGFPKSSDVGDAIERSRKEVRHSDLACERCGRTFFYCKCPADYQGWATTLKPAFEPVIVARKPLAGTVVANVLKHGTGALNIDGCRIGTDGGRRRGDEVPTQGDVYTGPTDYPKPAALVPGLGRFPANVMLDEAQAAELDRQSGESASPSRVPVAHNRTATRNVYSDGKPIDDPVFGYDDFGGASRFFYCTKAPSTERPRNGQVAHPTVKPLDLMRWLVRLVTPPGGTVLEPFAGSGTTAEACVIEGFRCIAIERELDYLPLIVARLTKPIQPDMFGGAA